MDGWIDREKDGIQTEWKKGHFINQIYKNIDLRTPDFGYICMEVSMSNLNYE